MPMSPPAPDEMRQALGLLRSDLTEFSQGVHDRIREAEEAGAQPRGGASSLVRIAASILPLPVVGGKVLLSGAKTGTVSAGYKMLGYLALPAVGIFLMLGAFVFSAMHIGHTRTTGSADPAEDAIGAWWRKNGWIAAVFYVGHFATMLWGSGEFIFWLLILSFVGLAVLLSALSRAGLASRGAIARTCCLGMLFMAMPIEIGPQHDTMGLFDGALGAGVLGLGAILVVLFGGPWPVPRNRQGARWGFVFGVLPLTLFSLHSLVRPATPSTMQAYVESFDAARYHTASWHKWEVAARWLQEQGRDMDLRTPRAFLFDEEIDGDQNSFVLGVAMGTGLLAVGDLPRLRKLPEERDALLRESRRASPFISLEQRDWSIRALVLEGSLHEEDRDHLAARLDATWERLRDRPHGRLEEALLIKELRALLHHPGDVSAQRGDVYAWILAARTAKASGIRPNGGFSNYEGGTTDERATWAAVSLMQHFGVPDEVDLLRVRSSARPDGNIFLGPNWTVAATRWKIDAIRGRAPSLLETMQCERRLMACILLTLLVLYAVLRAPRLNPNRGEPAPD